MAYDLLLFYFIRSSRNCLWLKGSSISAFLSITKGAKVNDKIDQDNTFTSHTKRISKAPRHKNLSIDLIHSLRIA
jgi:hypothetical protein